METVTDFIFLGSKITVNSDCSHEIKTFVPWKKTMTKLESILKKKKWDITLPTKVHIVKAMVFPVVIYSCENWTIKKAECWRIDVFELWCWIRLLRVPWTERRSNQSILEEINPDYSLEELMLRVKLHYFGHLIQRSNSLLMSLNKLQELVLDREAWCAAVHGIAKSQTWLSNWTKLNFPSIRVFSSESALRIRWLNYWSFNFSISSSNE